MKTLALAFVAALALTGVAASAAPAQPSDLWYRVRLDVDYHVLLNHAHLEEKSGWTMQSTSAVIVHASCRARTGGYLAGTSCAAAFAGRHRPAGAYDDLSFNAGAHVTWDVYTVIQRDPPADLPDGGKCTGRTTSTELHTPALYKGSISSGSLVNDGLRFSVDNHVLGGQVKVVRSGRACSYPDGRSGSEPDINETSRLVGPQAIWVPTLPGEAREKLNERLAHRNYGSLFGSSFIFSATVPTRPGNGQTKIRLSLSVCPHGGRAVRGC